ncbi:hypothetical protein GH721_10910 [Kriegella sp. EG-1]|nr:hypothetical protein [Flavobacteriaceae bacterium EG-1]
MKEKFFLSVFLSFGFLVIPSVFYAQEETPDINIEESSEVFLEEYSDAFQENFFEALKQKGIENYDKAINLLLQCKQLQPDNIVVDYELAKSYLADKQFIIGQDYAIKAVNAEPGNLWYLNVLVELVQKQGNTIDGIKSQLSFSDQQLKENLALIYYQQKKYEQALKVLSPLNASIFTEELESKINTAMKRVATKSKAIDNNSTAIEKNPLEAYRTELKNLIESDNIEQLFSLSKEALDTYPLQPFFYFANGHALNKMGKNKNAIEVLESGMDYMLDDVALENKFYTELSNAYTAIGDSVKANMYLSKVKPGF